MKTLLFNLFGAYEPMTALDANGDTMILEGWAGVDWPYVLGVVAFLIVLYSFFRIIGGLLVRK